MSNLQDALWYIELGWYVLPIHTPHDGVCSCGKADCQNVGKHPRTPGGVSDASIDRRQVEEWWTRWPDANIGVATGLGSNLVVLDVDAASGGLTSLAAWEKQQGGPIETVISKTGGGLHYFFTYPAGKKVGNKVGIRPGLDIRGEGGYVIVPPSVHKSGRFYTWELSPKWLSPASPEWILPLLETRAKIQREMPDIIPETRRNDTLFRFGCVMRDRGFSQDAIEAAIRVENQMRCVPPLSEEEISVIAASVSRYKPTRSVVSTKDGLILGSELLNYQFAEIEWVVENLLPPGLVLFGGRPKLGKSLFLLHLARAVCEGGMFLGRGVRQGAVLYISLEDGPRRIQARMRAQKWEEEYSRRLLLIFDDFRLDMASLSMLENYITQENLHLVIIDSMNRARRNDSLSENEAELARLLYPLSGVGQARDCTIILLHHHRKGTADDVINDFRGSSAIGGAGDTVIGIYPPKDGVNQLKIVGRDMEDSSENIYLDTESLLWYLAGQRKDGPTQMQQDILDAILQRGEAGVDVLAQAFSITRQAMLKHLGVLIDRGWVTQKMDGKRKLYILNNNINLSELCTE